MNKRLLSILLVLCMVLVSVPVFAFSATAETANAANETRLYEFTTSFSENLPTVSEDGTAITYNGNWTAWAYHKETWGGAALYDQANDWRYKAINTTATIPTAGYFQHNNSNFQGDSGAMISMVDNDPDKAPMIGSFAVGNNCAAVLRYTVEKTGVVDIIFDMVGNVSAGADFDVANFRYGVYLNGKKLWPQEGETLFTSPALEVEGTGANQIATDILAAKDVLVLEGDRIEFICEQSLGQNTVKPSTTGAGNVVFGTVAYVEETYESSFTDNIPTISGSAPVFHGNWSFVGYTPGEVNYANYTSVSNPSGWAGKLHDFSGLATTSKGTAGGWISLTTPHGNYQGSVVGTVGASTAQSMAIRYVAEKSGVANIFLDRLGNDAAKAVGDFTFYIYKNGIKIWPVNGEDNQITGPEMIYRTRTLVATGISVGEGDVIDFICEGSTARNPWGNGGNAIFGTIAYTKFHSSTDAYANNLPTATTLEAEVDTGVQFSGNWKAGRIWASAFTGTYAANNFYAFDWGTNRTASMYNGLGSMQDTFINLHNLKNAEAFFGPAGSIGAVEEKAAVIRYTADKTGVADIFIEKLGNGADLVGTSFDFAIFVNGAKVWPETGWATLKKTDTGETLTSDGKTFSIYADNYLIKSATVVCNDISVTAGDYIDFVCKINSTPSGAATTSAWERGGNEFFPAIAFEEAVKEYPAPSATATVRVSGSVSAVANIKMPKTVRFEASKGIYVDGVKVEGTNFLKGLPIKNIEKTVTVQSYYTTTQGDEIKGAEFETSIAKLLQICVDDPTTYGETVAKQAAAVLNYAAAAQKYFKMTEGTLKYTAQTPTGDYADKLTPDNIVNVEGATVKPKSVSLLLNDKVNIKFIFNVKEAGYTLKVASTREGLAEGTPVDIVYDKTVKEWVAVVDGITFNHWNTDMYFQVYQGETPVSASFIYSVSTYYARMNAQNDALTDLVNAMMVLYETTL